MLAADDDVDDADLGHVEQQLGEFERVPMGIVFPQGDQGAKELARLAVGLRQRGRFLRAVRPIAANLRADQGITPAQQKLRGRVEFVAFLARPQQRIDDELRREMNHAGVIEGHDHDAGRGQFDEVFLRHVGIIDDHGRGIEAADFLDQIAQIVGSPGRVSRPRASYCRRV